jgi:hypothetical protein
VLPATEAGIVQAAATFAFDDLPNPRDWSTCRLLNPFSGPARGSEQQLEVLTAGDCEFSGISPKQFCSTRADRVNRDAVKLQI